MQDTVERHSSVKVNTVFNGVCTNDKRTNTDISPSGTLNSFERAAFQMCVNERHVIEPILASRCRIPGRISGMRQWVSIITNSQFGNEHE